MGTRTRYNLRIARPVSDLDRATSMYCQGLDLAVLGEFRDQEGFDGVMLGQPGTGYHFEFTHCRDHPVTPATTIEDLVVFYIPDRDAWQRACASMGRAGFTQVAAYNPYWRICGRTFEDPDGYRVVLQNASWENSISMHRG